VRQRSVAAHYLGLNDLGLNDPGLNASFLSECVRKQDFPDEISVTTVFLVRRIRKQIMLKDDIAGSAQAQDLVQVCCGRFCVFHTPQVRASALGVSRAWTWVPRSRVANDNQLAWPCLAFAEDWYASC
jgi:hypothetical protein